MVLVEPSLRGRGVGTALMEHALARLDGLGTDRVPLDATPLGRPVYERLGFVAEYDILRHEGVVPDSVPRLDESVRAATPDQVERAIRLDGSVTGADRAALLTRLYGERPDLFRSIGRDGEVEGYVILRPGERAWQIGPCLGTEHCGRQLFAEAFGLMQKQRVDVDIPEANRASIAAAEAIGLRVQRTLTRMCRGPRPAERTAMIWASSGPEKG